jgi:DNA topoisomerase-1
MAAKTTTKAKTGKLKIRANFKYLVIVESPAKAKTIEKYLGKDFYVLASMGHLRDLPKSKLAVDPENKFEPSYIIIKGKAKILNQLKDAAKKAEIVYLAPDPDREGEAIAWHLAYALNLDESKIRRVEFNQITKETVQEAIAHPRLIDVNRVNAQQARRILDRLVGYKLSPLLWQKVRRGLSAGRVQSVAVKAICDRELLIDDFKPEEYWTIDTKFSNAKGEVVMAKLQSKKDSDEKLNVTNAAESQKIVLAIENAGQYEITDIRKKERRRNPSPPFITSTLQQEASRKLGFNARKTMMIAQQLYEGLEIDGGEQTGLITYMRTDSTRTADSALTEVRNQIKNVYGNEFVPSAPNTYKLKEKAQDAHEAIRPTLLNRDPKSLKEFLTPEQYKLYGLIWKRFLASQMAPAVLDTTSVDIAAAEYILRATGSVVKFAGFMSVYLEGKDDPTTASGTEDEDTENILPELTVGEKLKFQEIIPLQHFTQPPPRYTEATLVKYLEEKGIGRPSTYAPIISTIQTRNYVINDRKKLTPTDLGKAVNKQLEKHFPGIIDEIFTATIEGELDLVAEGQKLWTDVLKEFYFPFEADLKKAEVEMESIKVPDRVSDEKCEVCGKPMLIKVGRFGEFLACSGFPECKTTKSIIKPIGTCPKCKNPVVKKRTKRFRFFTGCSTYPKCDFACWEEPLPNENCPTCGAFMVLKGKKGEEQKLCIMCDIKNKEVEKVKETKVDPNLEKYGSEK